MAFSISFNVMGIDIELHWSLLILLLLIFLYDGIDAVLSISILFLFVILHELSHSYVAIKNGIGVKKITLLPIGGMASIEEFSIPPDVEFKLAIAGPLFNFIVVALALLVGLVVTGDLADSILSTVIDVNLVLGLFNLLPAIPLDGGRVWRSWREKKVGHLRATADAARLSRFAVITLLLFSAMLAISYDAFDFLVWNLLIAVVIYLGSESELSVAIIQDSAKGLSVRDAANFSPVCLAPDSSLDDAFSAMYSTKNPFIVVSSSPPTLLGYRQLSAVKRSEWGRTKAADIAQPSPASRLDEPILEAWKRMKVEDVPMLPVLFNNEIIGTVSETDIEKTLLLNRMKI